MKIIDKNGKSIEIKSIDEAIAITAEYKDYKHKEKSFAALDRERNLYWSDLHEKLLRLKEKQ